VRNFSAALLNLKSTMEEKQDSPPERERERERALTARLKRREQTSHHKGRCPQRPRPRLQKPLLQVVGADGNLVSLGVTALNVAALGCTALRSNGVEERREIKLQWKAEDGISSSPCVLFTLTVYSLVGPLWISSSLHSMFSSLHIWSLAQITFTSQLTRL